jgi:hypothetical protein
VYRYAANYDECLVLIEYYLHELVRVCVTCSLSKLKLLAMHGFEENATLALLDAGVPIDNLILSLSSPLTPVLATSIDRQLLQRGMQARVLPSHWIRFVCKGTVCAEVCV